MKDIKIRLEEYDINLVNRVSDKTRTQINLDQDGWIDVDDILSLLSELESENTDLQIKLDEIRENCKPCDINDNWQFYSKTIKDLQIELDKQHKFIKEKGLLEEYGK